MKIALLFPGYGSQFVGMGKELYDEYRIVQEYFEEASNCLNINFVKLCFASSEAELSKINNAYASLFLISSSISALLRQEDIIHTATAGYNTGEYAAISESGGMSFPDGLYLLTKLSSFYFELLEKIDVQIIQVKGISTKDIQEICLQASVGENKAFVAIYNSHDEQIIAGNMLAIENVRNLGIRVNPATTFAPIPLGVGLHSELMDSVVNQYKIYLEKVDFKDLKVPLISNLDGVEVAHHSNVKERIIRQINNSLIWFRVLEKLAFYDVIIEIGPGTKLSSMVKKIYSDKLVTSINKRSDIEELKINLSRR